MSSMRKESGQGSDATGNRRAGFSAKPDSESVHNGSSLNSSGGYDQRRSHAYGDYGMNSGANSEYMKYYPGYDDGYGGWSSGGNTGYYQHGLNIGSPMSGPYGGNSTLFGNGGNGQSQTNHTGYYYNYFPNDLTNDRGYSTWSGPNLVTTQRTGGTRHVDFYHTPSSDYVFSSGRGNSFTHHHESNTPRLYDSSSSTEVGVGSGSTSSFHHSKISSSSGCSDSKKKSWANIASQPAKMNSSAPLGIGRGRGRGIPIGGVPGSAKAEPYLGVGRGSEPSWGSSLQNRAPAATVQRNLAPVSSVSAAAQNKLSPLSGNLDRNADAGSNWKPNSFGRSSGKNVDEYSSPADVEGSVSPKWRDYESINGSGGADANNGAYEGVPQEKKSSGPGYFQVPNDVDVGLDKLSLDDYNPKELTLPMKGARFFVIKSYSEDDVHRSIKYGIWCSTEHGNKRLDSAFKEREGTGPIYLLYSVNASGHFCGVAQMISALDYEKSSGVWAQDKWKGQFLVKWIYVKDVPNQQLRHIRLENNENKPVTNSRDTQEVPPEKGRQVVKVIHQYAHTTSLFDDFAHYEKRQEEENARKGKRGGNQDDHYTTN